MNYGYIAMIEIHQLPVVQSCDDKKHPWSVVRSAHFTFNDVYYVIPVGYKTDLASVPRIPFIYARYGGKAREAAVIHDWLYDKCVSGITRKEADWVFHAVMELTNDPCKRSQRYMMWLGVRIGGWRGWNTDSSAKCKGEVI
jgi:hypothetical protein